MPKTFRSTLLAVLCAVTLLAVVPAHARTVTRSLRYDAPLILGEKTRQVDRTCDAKGKNCKVFADGRAEVGGLNFDPIGGRGKPVNVTLTIRDDVDLFTMVSVEVCANTNPDTICDDTDKAYHYTCLTWKDKLLLRGVPRSAPILLYVNAVYSCDQFVNSLPQSQGGGTTGVATLRYTL